MALIRVAQLQDAAAISHVHVQSWLSTYRGIVPSQYLASLKEADRIPQWQEWLTRDICAFVAEIDGSIVAFAAAGPIREPLASCDAELYSIYLLEEVQGRGIDTFATKLGVKNASLLSEELRNLCREEGRGGREAQRLRHRTFPDCSTGVGLLLSNYIGAMVLAFSGGFNAPVMFGVHAVLATLLIYRTWRLDAAGWV